MFAMCYVSMCVFCDYAAEKHQAVISKNKIIDNYKQLWNKRTIRTISREGLIQKMFQALISDKAFFSVKPRAEELCESYFDGTCTHYDEFQSGYSPCDTCRESSTGYYYDPDRIMRWSV